MIFCFYTNSNYAKIPWPITFSATVAATKPMMAILPFVISAPGVKIPYGLDDGFDVYFSAFCIDGINEAAVINKLAKTRENTWSCNCAPNVSWL